MTNQQLYKQILETFFSLEEQDVFEKDDLNTLRGLFIGLGKTIGIEPDKRLLGKEIAKPNTKNIAISDKEKIWPPIDFDQEKANGVDAGAAYIKSKIWEYINPNAPARSDKKEYYEYAINGIKEILSRTKTFDEARHISSRIRQKIYARSLSEFENNSLARETLGELFIKFIIDLNNLNALVADDLYSSRYSEIIKAINYAKASDKDKENINAVKYRIDGCKRADSNQLKSFREYFGLSKTASRDEIIKRLEKILSIYPTHDKSDWSWWDKKKEVNKISGKKIKKEVSIVYGSNLELETGAETHKAKYGIIDLSDLVASHNWFDYSKNENYPPGCQERQYHDNKQLQANVEMRSKNFKPTHLLNEDLTPESGPSIINPDGIVLGGNSRVMILNRVKANYPDHWKNYQDKLHSHSFIYGIDKSLLEMFENPVLVRVVDVNMDKCSHYSWVFNTSTKNDTDVTDRALTLSKELSDDTIYELSQVIESAEVETYSQMFDDRSVRQKIEKILKNAGVINPTNQTAWINETGGFTATAKIMIESILNGTILNDKRLAEAAKNYADRITRSISVILKIRSLAKPWNLIPDFEEAIKLEESRRTSKQTKKDFLVQSNMFGEKATERTLLVWDLLDLKPVAFKAAAKNYAKIAVDQLNSDDAFFSKVEVTPIQALRKVLDKANGLADKCKKHGRKK